MCWKATWKSSRHRMILERSPPRSLPEGAVATAHAWLGQFVRRHIAPLHEQVIEAVVYAIPVYEAISSSMPVSIRSI